MISFELILGDLYSAGLEYYDILLKPNILEIDIKTTRGVVKYVITSTLTNRRDILSIRDEIAGKLDASNCRIKEDEKKLLYFDNLKYSGTRTYSSFLPN